MIEDLPERRWRHESNARRIPLPKKWSYQMITRTCYGGSLRRALPFLAMMALTGPAYGEQADQGESLRVYFGTYTRGSRSKGIYVARLNSVTGELRPAELAAEEHQVSALMERLVREGVRMNSFTDKEPTLEDVFMLVTKGVVA